MGGKGGGERGGGRVTIVFNVTLFHTYMLAISLSLFYLSTYFTFLFFKFYVGEIISLFLSLSFLLSFSLSLSLSLPPYLSLSLYLSLSVSPSLLSITFSRNFSVSLMYYCSSLSLFHCFFPPLYLSLSLSLTLMIEIILLHKH